MKSFLVNSFFPKSKPIHIQRVKMFYHTLLAENIIKPELLSILGSGRLQKQKRASFIYHFNNIPCYGERFEQPRHSLS